MAKLGASLLYFLFSAEMQGQKEISRFAGRKEPA
jgi:hypothetical protein